MLAVPRTTFCGWQSFYVGRGTRLMAAKYKFIKIPEGIALELVSVICLCTRKKLVHNIYNIIHFTEQSNVVPLSYQSVRPVAPCVYSPTTVDCCQYPPLKGTASF